MVVAAALTATVEAVILRGLGSSVSQAQILLFRSGMQVALVLLYGLFITRRPMLIFKTGRPRDHLVRGVLSAVSWWCYYMSFKSLPLALATTLTFSAQLFVLLLVWPMLRERVTRPQFISTLVGFIGVLIAAGLWNPFTMDWRVLYGLASAFIGAVMIIITRSLTLTDRSETVTFYMALAVFVSAIPQSLFDWPPLDLRSTALLVLMGTIGALGSWWVVIAYRHAETSELAPYGYARLVFAAVLGYLVFGDVVAGTTWVGALLVVGSNLVFLIYISRLTRRAP